MSGIIFQLTEIRLFTQNPSAQYINGILLTRIVRRTDFNVNTFPLNTRCRFSELTLVGVWESVWITTESFVPEKK